MKTNVVLQLLDVLHGHDFLPTVLMSVFCVERKPASSLRRVRSTSHEKSCRTGYRERTGHRMQA